MKRIDLEDESQADIISLVYEFNEIHEFMEDESVDRALELLVKTLFSKGGPPPGTVESLIVEMQALAAKFALLATYYQTIGKGGTEETHKKNVYYTLRDAFTKLADNLKYLVK